MIWPANLFPLTDLFWNSNEFYKKKEACVWQFGRNAWSQNGYPGGIVRAWIILNSRLPLKPAPIHSKLCQTHFKHSSTFHFSNPYLSIIFCSSSFFVWYFNLVFFWIVVFGGCFWALGLILFFLVLFYIFSVVVFSFCCFSFLFLFLCSVRPYLVAYYLLTVGLPSVDLRLTICRPSFDCLRSKEAGLK